MMAPAELSPRDFTPTFHRLEAKRVALDLSQGQAAALVGVHSQSSMSRLARGIASHALMLRYAHTLGEELVLGVDITVSQLWNVLRRELGTSCIFPEQWLDAAELRNLGATGPYVLARAHGMVAAQAAAFIGFCDSPLTQLKIYDGMEEGASRIEVESYSRPGFPVRMCRAELSYDPNPPCSISWNASTKQGTIHITVDGRALRFPAMSRQDVEFEAKRRGYRVTN